MVRSRETVLDLPLGGAGPVNRKPPTCLREAGIVSRRQKTQARWRRQSAATRRVASISARRTPRNPRNYDCSTGTTNGTRMELLNPTARQKFDALFMPPSRTRRSSDGGKDIF